MSRASAYYLEVVIMTVKWRLKNLAHPQATSSWSRSDTIPEVTMHLIRPSLTSADLSIQRRPTRLATRNPIHTSLPPSLKLNMIDIRRTRSTPRRASRCCRLRTAPATTTTNGCATVSAALTTVQLAVEAANPVCAGARMPRSGAGVECCAFHAPAERVHHRGHNADVG
jgi:hypothetical protein